MEKLKSFKELLKKQIADISIQTNSFGDTSIDPDLIIFIVLDGSDSVKLVWDILADIYYIEVFPIDQNKKINVYNFTSKESSIIAFNMWQDYYFNVVKENFKMF